MILVASGIMQKKIKQIVSECQDYNYTFVKQEGINLYFTIEEGDEVDAAAKAKKALKADPICTGLLLSVKVVPA